MIKRHRHGLWIDKPDLVSCSLMQSQVSLNIVSRDLIPDETG